MADPELSWQQRRDIARRDVGVTNEDRQAILAAVRANIHGVNDDATQMLAGVMEGLLMGMNDIQRASYLANIRTSVTSTAAMTLAQNAEDADRLQREALLRRLRREQEERQPDLPNLFRALMQIMRNGNATGPEILAAARRWLGSDALISGAWARYMDEREAPRRAAMEAAVYASMEDYAASRGTTLSSASFAKEMNSVVGAAYYMPHYYRSREEYHPQDVWSTPYNYNPDQPNYGPGSANYQQPDVPPREREEARRAAEIYPGAVLDPHTNTVFAPGVGQISVQGGQSRVIRTPAELQQDQERREALRRRAEEMGGRLLPDGRTIEFPNGSQVQIDQERGMTRIVTSPLVAQQRRAEQIASLVPQVIQDERRRIATTTGVPPESITVAPPLHSNGIAVRPPEAAAIRHETREDQRILAEQREAERREALAAVGIAPRRDPAPVVVDPGSGVVVQGDLPQSQPARPTVLGWRERLLAWAGRDTVSGRRIDNADVDASNTVVRSAAERERDRGMTGAVAGIFRRAWHRWSGDDTAPPNETEEQRIARETRNRETARWAHSWGRWVWGGGNTAEQERIEAEARARQPQPPAQYSWYDPRRWAGYTPQPETAAPRVEVADVTPTIIPTGEPASRSVPDVVIATNATTTAAPSTYSWYDPRRLIWGQPAAATHGPTNVTTGAPMSVTSSAPSTELLVSGVTSTGLNYSPIPGRQRYASLVGTGRPRTVEELRAILSTYSARSVVANTDTIATTGPSGAPSAAPEQIAVGTQSTATAQVAATTTSAPAHVATTTTAAPAQVATATQSTTTAAPAQVASATQSPAATSRPRAAPAVA